MSPSQLSVLAVLGVACLASSVLLARMTPAARDAILDTVYL